MKKKNGKKQRIKKTMFFDESDCSAHFLVFLENKLYHMYFTFALIITFAPVKFTLNNLFY